jgi:hypothetical protein
MKNCFIVAEGREAYPQLRDEEAKDNGFAWNSLSMNES